MKPTVFMIKQHRETGLKYFCKTVRLNKTYSYLGSGVRWTRHLEKHGRNVETVWVSEVFTDEEETKRFGLSFSEENKIVESNEWANLVPEDGLMGGDHSNGYKHNPERKRIISEKAKSRSEKVKRKTAQVRKDNGSYKTGAIKGVQTKNKNGTFEKAQVKRLETVMSVAWKEENWICCPHCNKVCDPGNFKRWHGDKCKHK